jgi:hypothetical protein
MKLFRTFWGWLSQKQSGAAHRWDPITNPVDVAKIARDLRLREEGARLGALGFPQDTETSLCGPEEQAVRAIGQARTDYLEWGQMRLRSLNGELTRLDVTQELIAAAESGEEFERQAAAVITANAPAVQRLQEMAASRQLEFDRFRLENKRLNLPHYPQGLHKALAWVFAFFLITVEAVLNARFFAKGLEGGLIEGFSEAAIAATLNVTFCFIAGCTVIRFIHHVKTGPKLFGLVMTLMTGGVIVGLALVVAHYREALVLGLDDAQSVAIQTLVASPFTLKEVSSWYLFMIGIIFGLAALFDGYKTDDSYPGYGNVHRKTVEAADAYSNAIDQLHEHLSELKEAMLAKVEGALNHSATAIVSFKDVIAAKEKCGHDLANAIKDAPSGLAVLLGEFRMENVMARMAQGHAKPPSFNVTPVLHDLEIPDFDTAYDRISLGKQETLRAEFLNKAPEIRARIQAGYNNANFDSLHTLVSHFSGTAASPTAAQILAPVKLEQAGSLGGR